MGRLNHPLAANGTKSWPHFVFQRPRRSPSAGLPGPPWNHLMAETADLASSVGRELEARRSQFLVFHSSQASAIQPTQKRLCEAAVPASESSAGGKFLVSSAARNHPMAAQVWTHHLAKMAIGWVE